MNAPSTNPGKPFAQESQAGIVIRLSRRTAHILSDQQETIAARMISKVKGLTVGDRVAFQKQGQETLIQTVLPRQNCLYRDYRNKTKEIAANLDRLFVVTAVKPLFNTSFIDRVLVFCTLQNIPCTIILNKIDLALEETRPLVSIYEKLGVQVLYTSALEEESLNELKHHLAQPALKIAALAGVSGVGKSTLLNHLMPEAQIKTSQVSHKTGQGKRTTSQASAYAYTRPDAADLLLIDLPGVHSFGVSTLSEKEVAAGFPEFTVRWDACEYFDCVHAAEPNCAVKEALEAGQIAPSRYLSYLGMLDEIRDARPY
jgi:ribosome biogenesis GTPase / thiamine phosphate phosphatase